MMQYLHFPPPPIWPDVKTELRKYIECPERLPIHQLDRTQCYWSRTPEVLSLLNFDLAPVGTTLKFDRDPIIGCLGKMHETVVKGIGDTARNSMSMTRAPVTTEDGVRGNPSNIPFWPGGFDEPEITDDTILEDIDFEKNLRTLAKGFSAGVEFKSDNCTVKEQLTNNEPKDERRKTESEVEKVNLMAIVHEEENMLGLWSPAENSQEEEKKVINNLSDELPLLEDDIPTLPMDNIPVLKISEKKPTPMQAEWAEQLDVSVPVDDFEKKIPDPALTFEYKLDIFQKQAILKLEQNCNVFVAAHTSAGKTTVAEYAIALSQKHMTRVIYTSPIKALSNQKYRDFKKKFESVGLLTGDLQINQTASCLIMTTEILQSMLYCASEVLRDLEFVIFDEVHYINNEDRGHVWEEIVILLPQTVTIVMLSATVPNPLEFANWVGRIKRRKMYVISTMKRPIPLQHYLYTGTDGRTKDDIFLMLDANNQLRLDGWHQAYLAKHPKGSKETKGSSKRKTLTAKQEKDVWRGFINHLKKNDLLPVVVFTLSRRRCDTSAAALESLDLTTANEKHKVHVLFKNSIKHLKGSDRELPQVLLMQRLLEKGVGIHHSGILPILKEIVEMLFQSGVVKLLFATETFAMGVNMPARTVAFDSIQKYDGNAFRLLFPTEYIQMAGRAGRRGHDTTGTVIIMCRHDVPELNDLKSIMCGEPQTLQSKFKVTYSMVLNLRRVNESVTVEAMMRRSFRESSTASKQSVFRTKLMEVEQELANLPPLTSTQQTLSEFYQLAVEYLEEFKQLRPNMLESKKAVKNLTEGKVLLISHNEHYNKLAILLSVPTQRNQSNSQYKVLVLKNADVPNSEKDTTNESNTSNDKNERWHRIIALTKQGVFVPTGTPSYEILILSPWDILEITSYQLKVDCNVVLKEWEKKQISRIRNEPPSSACSLAIQELTTLSFLATATPAVLLPFLELKASHDLAIRERDLRKLQQKLYNMKCIHLPNFEEQFEPVFQRSELEYKKRHLQLKLSDEGLALYPEYVRMVSLLKDLRYIDSDERVALKGRVALQMGSNELLITELILKNVLTTLPPAEIVALLSALIFQQRTDTKPTLTPELKQGCAVMEEVFSTLQRLEQTYGISTLQPLNFGLVEVVYEWAQGKSFAEITERTDVQEGIIVRCIQQLNETLQDVKNAAVTIGDPVLKEKMEEASTAIKRDIVFTASLYTQD